MKKTKTKKISRKPRTKKYPVQYFAVILAAALLLEGILFSVPTGADWKYGLELFDMSDAVVELALDLQQAAAPQAVVYQDVTSFYMAAADEITPMLDLSESTSSIAAVWIGVSTFYEQASIELAGLLDVSDSWSNGRVSGISIIVR